ncbi:MAG: DUF2975 domain-containing protein [Pseudomonadota bacterium]
MSTSPDTVLSDRTLKRRSRVAAGLCLGAAVFLPLSVLAALALGNGASALYASRIGLSLSHAPSGAAIILATIVALLPALCASAALLSARRFLSHVADGRWFDQTAGRAIRNMGLWGIAGAICGLVAPSLIGLILTAGAAAGERSLVISIGSGPLLALLFGAVLYLIGDVMRRAAALSADHASII